MSPLKPATLRKRDERERNRAAGLVMITVWAAPDDREVIKDHATQLLNEHLVSLSDHLSVPERN